MFPGAYASIDRNEVGEVLGWDNPSYFQPDYDPYDDDYYDPHDGDVADDEEI